MMSGLCVSGGCYCYVLMHRLARLKEREENEMTIKKVKNSRKVKRPARTWLANEVVLPVKNRHLEAVAAVNRKLDTLKHEGVLQWNVPNDYGCAGDLEFGGNDIPVAGKARARGLRESVAAARKAAVMKWLNTRHSVDEASPRIENIVRDSEPLDPNPTGSYWMGIITPKMHRQKWFKVAVNGAAANGGTGDYHLPDVVNNQWRPGAWHTPVDSLQICRFGYHVTRQPQKWAVIHSGMQVFAVELTGNYVADRPARTADKIAVTSFRILRPATCAEMQKYFPRASWESWTAMTALWKRTPADRKVLTTYERDRRAKLRAAEAKRRASWRVIQQKKREHREHQRAAADLRVMKRLAKRYGWRVFLH
jgi:hypothetical protein